MSNQQFWKKNNGHWTERLKQLQAERLSAREIATVIERESGRPVSRNSALSRLHRIGLSPMSTKAGYGGRGRKGKVLTAAKPGRLTGIIATTGHGGHKSRTDLIFGQPNIIKPWNPPPPSEDQKEIKPGQGRRLLDLSPNECRWPINEPKRDEFFLFCGAPVVTAGKQDWNACPYCEAHARRAGAGYGRAA